MIVLPELTIYITHTCDLACEGCFTFNQLAWGKHFKVNDSVKVLKDKVEFNDIFLLGGEPLLNPYLDSWKEWVHNMWPNSKKWIVTNGRHLDKIPKWWDNGWLLEISAHSKQDLESIKTWLRDHNIDLEKFYQPGHTDASTHYHLTYNDAYIGELSESWEFYKSPAILEQHKEISWTSLEDKNLQHSMCPAKECMHLLDGRFYRCQQQAILPQLSKQFKINDKYKSIASEDTGASPQEFLEWIKTKDNPQEQCRLCNWSKKFNLPEESVIKKIKVLSI